MRRASEATTPSAPPSGRLPDGLLLELTPDLLAPLLLRPPGLPRRHVRRRRLDHRVPLLPNPPPRDNCRVAQPRPASLDGAAQRLPRHSHWCPLVGALIVATPTAKDGPVLESRSLRQTRDNCE